MSEQENNPPHILQEARVLAQSNTVPFAATATNSLTASLGTIARKKVAVFPTTSQPLSNALSQEQPAQPSLSGDGICVTLKDDLTPSQYGVKRALNGVYNLVLQSPSLGEQPHCKFILLPKGDYIGVQCAAAKGRYLQARKQGLQRLVFYSDHCGIWEQWKVLTWSQDGAEGQSIIKLSSRRLPGFTWTVRAIPADLHEGGRPSSGDATDGDDAHAEEGTLDLSMRLTKGFVHRLHLGPLPAVFATWRQLAVQSKKRRGQLRKCEQRWHRRWVQEGFARWRDSTAAMRRRRCLLQRAGARRASRLLHAAMSAWLQHATHQRSLHCAEAVLRSAHMRHQLSSAFGGWAQLLEAERQMAATCARLTAWHALRRLRALFAAWASLTQQEHLGRLADVGLLEALEGCQGESEDGPNAALTFPMQSRQRKSLSRLAMLKQQRRHPPGWPAMQHASGSPRSAAPSTDSNHCTNDSNFQDGMEALPEKWHTALEVQPAEASPAVQLSGCWTEARPGMPSAVTRSQLRAPTWHPAGGAVPAQLQICTPARIRSATPHAATPHPQSRHSKGGSSDAGDGGASTLAPACLELGTSMSPPARLPEVAAAGNTELPCGSAVPEREETPFFTPVAALPKPKPPSSHASRPASSRRLMAATGHEASLLQGTRPEAPADRQAQSPCELLCQPSPEMGVMAWHMLELSPCVGSSTGARCSREGSSSLQELQEDPSRQEDTDTTGSNSTGPGTALRANADPAHSSSSSTGSWETDMARCGSPGAPPLSPDTGWLSVSDRLELQRTPPRQEGHGQAPMSAASSMGECMTPDMAGHDFLPLPGDRDIWRAEALLQGADCRSASAALQQLWMVPRAAPQRVAHLSDLSPAKESCANCHMAHSSAGVNEQDTAPVEQVPPLCSADNAQPPFAEPVSAQQLTLAGLQGSSREGLRRPSSGHGSRPSARSGNWLCDSHFWEAPAGALPGQATQSPLPCRPGINTMLVNPAVDQACPQAQGPQLVSGAEAACPGTGRSVADDSAIGCGSSIAACADAQSSSPQASPPSLPTPEPPLSVTSHQHGQPVEHQPAAYRSVAHDIAAGHSLSFAAWAAAEDDPAEGFLSPPMTSESALSPALCQQPGTSVPGQPAAHGLLLHDNAPWRCSWTAGEDYPAEYSASVPGLPGLVLMPALCTEDQQTPGQPAISQSAGHDTPAKCSSSVPARAAVEAAAAGSMHALSPPDLMSPSASCTEDQPVAGGSVWRFGPWQQADDLTAEQLEQSILSVPLPQAAKTYSGSSHMPAAPGSRTAKVSPPAQASSAASHHQAEGRTTGCELSCISPAALQSSQQCGGVQDTRLGQQGVQLRTPHGQQLRAHGSADGLPSPSANHHTQELASGADTSAASSSPAQQRQSGANKEQGSDFHQAARQGFGGLPQCHSPALALRGWDGSIQMAFTAWQHVTVLLWQRRLETAAPLLRRRRFRMLAWPFRAWAAQADHRHQAASSHAAAAEDIPSAAILHLQQHAQQTILHNSFWHWQEETVWGWKLRRDALAAARTARLRKVLHVWRSLAAADEDAAVHASHSAGASACKSLAFQAWLTAAREKAAAAAAAAAFQVAGQGRRLAAVLRAWLEVARSRAASRAAVQHMSGQRKVATLAAALQHWRLLAERSRRVAALSEKVQCSVAKHALNAWRHAAQRSRQLRAAGQLMREAAARIRAARAFVSWRSVRSMSHALSAFQHQHAVRFAKHALQEWQVHAAHAGHVRSAAASLAALRRAHLARQGLQALQEHMSSCREARKLANRHAATCCHRMLGKCLAIWRSQARAAKRCAELAEHLQGQKLQRSLVATWQQWRGAVQTAAAQAEVAERCAAQRQAQLLSAVVHAWRMDTELTLRNTAIALLQCLRRKAWVMQQQVMSAWQMLVQHLKAARAQAEASQHAREAGRLRASLRSWSRAASEAGEARAAAVLVFQLRSNTRTAQALLTAWQEQAASAGIAHLRAYWMAQERKVRLLRQSLACWWRMPRLWAIIRQVTLEAHRAHWSGERLRQYLSAWRAHHTRLQAVRAAAEAYGQGRESAAQQSIMTEWRHVTRAERIVREGNLQSFQAASQRRLLSCVLAHWQALHRSMQAARAAAEERHGALQAATLQAAFLMWRLVSASAANSQQLSCESVSRAFSLRKLRSLLRAWAILCRAARAARQAAQDLASQARLRSMQRAFSAWRAANASLQHQRSMLLGLCIELAHERRLSEAFTAWHGIAWSRHKAVVQARSLGAQRACRTLRQAFAVWRISNAALAHQQRSAAEQLLAAKAQRAQHGAFLAWRQHISHMRAARATAAVKGLAQQKSCEMVRLTGILRAWSRYTRECADRELAEASLMRSIILTRAFHSWAAVACSSQLQEPAQYANSLRHSAALAEGIGKLELQRTANWEKLRRSSADGVSQSRHLQDEIRHLQDRLHAEHLCAWQSMHVARWPC